MSGHLQNYFLRIYDIMKKLTDGQKLYITRISQCATLETIAKRVFLSISSISLMENGNRKVPDFVKDILKIDEEVKWYETIVASLSGDKILESDAEKALKVLNNILRVR